MDIFAPLYPVGVLDVDVLAITVQMESPAIGGTIHGRTIVIVERCGPRPYRRLAPELTVPAAASICRRRSQMLWPTP
jgi:hypothetical protein